MTMNLSNRKTLVVALFVTSATIPLKATVFTATSPADSGPGSLRDTIAASSVGDIIQFAFTGKILLNSAITIDHSLWVQGPGAGALTVDAQHLDRAFVLTAIGTVQLSGMTVSNGYFAGPNGADAPYPGLNGGSGMDAYGGAILCYCDWLSLSNCWFTGNVAQGGHGGFGGPNPIGAAFVPGNGGAGGFGVGGAIYATSVVFMVNCTFSGNRAVGGNGGAGGTNFNTAVNESGGTGGDGGYGQGGAVDMINAAPKHDRQFQNSTFSGNFVGGGGGGAGGDSSLGSGGPGGNGGQGGGGAIATLLVDLYGLTIVSNSAYGGSGGFGGNGIPPGASGNSAIGTAGGVLGYTITCQSDIENTILAENFANGGGAPNYFIGLTDLGFNYLGTDDTGFCAPLNPTTRMGTTTTPLHPQLGPLSQNGGGAPTHATTLTSPVTDAGTQFPLPFDERGAPRPYDFSSIPNYMGGDGSDIGAFELGAADLGMGAISNNNLVLSWPGYYGDFQLESATNLQGASNWTVVPGVPVLVGNQFVVTNRMTNGIQFFRLVNH